MESIKLLFFLSLISFLVSCKHSATGNQLNDGKARNLVPDTTIHPKGKMGTIPFSKAILYTIDSSVYKAQDTMLNFPDGRRAYKAFFGGRAFIDSSGKPVHKRFHTYELDQSGLTALRNNFLSKFCDQGGRACTPIFRDVIVLYDAAGDVTGQVQICFGCSLVVIYPHSKFPCAGEEPINFEELKAFISHMQQKQTGS